MCHSAGLSLGSMASGEVSWDDEKDVKEIIADVRDVECDMAWCVLLPLLVLTVVTEREVVPVVVVQLRSFC